MDRRSGPNQTRLVLVTPPVADTYKIAPVLAASVKAADVAAVVLRLAPGKDAEQIMRVHALAPTVQNAGAALLIDGRVDLVTQNRRRRRACRRHRCAEGGDAAAQARIRRRQRRARDPAS